MFWRPNLPAFIWAIFALVLCGLPGDNFPELTFLEWLSPDKIAHLVLFGVQCFLLLSGFTKQTSFVTLKKKATLWALSFTISYGILVEILQTYIFVQRNGDVRDAIANSIGAFTGWWVWNKFYAYKKSRAIN